MKDISFEEYAGVNLKKITRDFVECVETFNEMHLSEIIDYCSSLMEEYGDAQYKEQWYGYEDFRPTIVSYREETEDEYNSRIEELMCEYERSVAWENKERNERIQALEKHIQELESNIEEIKKGKYAKYSGG